MEARSERRILSLLVLAAGVVLLPYLSLRGSTVHWQSLSGAYVQDGDGDGVADAVEAGAPFDGDGNRDGIQDDRQAAVASLPDAQRGDYWTIDASPLGRLSGVTALRSPTEEDPAPGLHMPMGVLRFQVSGMPVGGAAYLTITSAGGDAFDQYWRYGPEADRAEPHWYRFDGSRPGAEIIGARSVVLQLRDGARGDDDLEPNGRIDVLGGPGLKLFELASLEQRRTGRNVHLDWRTDSERDLRGFDVIRRDASGKASRVSHKSIQARGGPRGGAEYRFIDWMAPDGPLQYWIEAEDQAGRRARSGVLPGRSPSRAPVIPGPPKPGPGMQGAAGQR